MYIPPAFKIDDDRKLAKFIGQHSFATVITQDGGTPGAPFASQIPILFDPDPVGTGRLLGHVARANPQWNHFENSSQEVLVIFHGPHAYISPRWYETGPAVPTWNYAAVHVYGRASLIADDLRLKDLVMRMVRFYEGDGPDAWRGDLPDEYMAKMLKGIAGFEIAITRMEGKFKLSQNRPKNDIAGVHTALSQSDDAGDRMLADLMRDEGLA